MKCNTVLPGMAYKILYYSKYVISQYDQQNVSWEWQLVLKYASAKNSFWDKEQHESLASGLGGKIMSTEQFGCWKSPQI